MRDREDLQYLQALGLGGRPFRDGFNRQAKREEMRMESQAGSMCLASTYLYPNLVKKGFTQAYQNAYYAVKYHKI